MHQPSAKEVWRTLAITSICLVAIGLGAFGIDFVTIGQFNFISSHYEVFLFAIPIGVVLLLISLVGWASTLGKRGRARIATFTLIVPIAVVLIGFALGGTNVHGPFYLFLLPMVPLIPVGIVVAIMAVRARST